MLFPNICGIESGTKLKFPDTIQEGEKQRKGYDIPG